LARRPEADSGETVERILAATHAVLDREGVQAISLRKVAREAGLSVGTLSYYFPSAEALWEACVDAHYVRVEAFALRYLASAASEASPRDKLREAVRAAYTFALEDRLALRLVLALSARRGGLNMQHQHHRAATFRALAALWPESERPADFALRAQTLVYACTRYACSSVGERLVITGAPTEEAADAAIADHLAEAAVELLFSRERSEAKGR
jgi:AcrR family transcriptional regulator